MPKWVAPVLIMLAALALVPFACIARARAVRSERPRLHLISDMDNQGRFKSQQASPWFADGRAARHIVEGTVARGEFVTDPHYTTGFVDGAYADTFPDQIEVDLDLLRRGQQRFNIYCAPCHGQSGYGDGPVARRADRLQQGTWIPPASFHAEPAYSRPVGHLYNTITNGIRNMPAYGPQIQVHDRWAIVAYIKALQRSQHARVEDVPPDVRPTLR